MGSGYTAAAAALLVAVCGCDKPASEDGSADGGTGDGGVDISVQACPWIADHVYANPSDVVFEPSQVVRIELEIAPADYEFLLGNPDLEEYRPVTLVFCGERLEGAGLRFKRSSHPSADLPDGYPKNPMLIDLSEFHPGQKLRGLRHINLEYGGDAMLLAERMNWEVLRAAGVTSSRVGYAELFINGANVGVFTNVERVDRSYASHRFGDDDGNLYKHQYCGTFVWEGSSVAAYVDDPQCYEKKTNEAAADYADLIHVLDVLNNTPEDRLEVELPVVLDVDAWIPLMAGLQVLGYGDTPAANGNNFYTYHSASTSRFHILPWDLDGGFFQPDAPCEHPADTIGWDLFRIARCHGYLPLFERLVARPAWRQRYLQEARAIVDGPFSPVAFASRVDGLIALVGEALARDPNRDGDDAAMAEAAGVLKERQAQRHAAVQAQLP